MQNPVLPCKNNKTDITYYTSTCHYHTVPLVSFHQTAADHISYFKLQSGTVKMTTEKQNKHSFKEKGLTLF